MKVEFLSHISPAGCHVYNSIEYPDTRFEVGSAGELYIRKRGSTGLVAIYAAGVWRYVR